MKKTDHHVYFAVFGFDADPFTLTLMAGLKPDDDWSNGEKFSDALPDAVRLDNRLIIYSGLDRDASQ